MKRFLIIYIALCGCLSLVAQDAYYTHYWPNKKKNGCRVYWYAEKVLGSVDAQAKQLTVGIESKTDLTFLAPPKVVLYLFNRDSICLSGTKVEKQHNARGIYFNAYYIKANTTTSLASFRLTPAQIEQLAEGVIAVRIPTLPEDHLHIFKRDEIGYPLYRALHALP